MEDGAVSLLGRMADRVLGERVADCDLPHPVPPGVTVRRGRLVPRVGGWFMGGSRAPAGAVTFGRTILCNPDRPLTDDLIVHELVHVEQWKDPLFAVKYVAGWMQHGYRRNPFEEEAYARQRQYLASKKTVPPRPL
jgi:hypothetical protein